jgi:hypothetical protein
MAGQVEGVLESIESPSVRAFVSNIFADPALFEQTLSSCNHSGPVKTAGAIKLPQEPWRFGLVGFDPTPAILTWAATKAGHPSHARSIYGIQGITRVGLLRHKLNLRTTTMTEDKIAIRIEQASGRERARRRYTDAEVGRGGVGPGKAGKGQERHRLARILSRCRLRQRGALQNAEPEVAYKNEIVITSPGQRLDTAIRRKTPGRGIGDGTRGDGDERDEVRLSPI